MKQRLSIADLARKGWLYFSDGYRTKKPELGPTGYPIMRVAQVLDGYLGPASDPEYVRDEFKKKIGLKSSVNGDVILTTKGTVGRMAKITAKDEGYVYSPQVCFFRILDAERIDRNYLYYTMAADDFRSQMLAVSTQTDMAPYINLKDLGSLEIDVPELTEQRSIASILGALDDKIELNRRMNGTLEAMAQALFKEWFVDGAKEEWEETSLGEQVEVVKGLSYKGSGLADAGRPMHNLNSIYEFGRYKYEGIKWYTGEFKDRHICKAGDVIVANTEQGFDHLLIGSAAIVPKRFGDEGLFTHHIYRVRPLPTSYLTNHFLYLLLTHPSVREQVQGYTNGTTVNSLAKEGLERPTFALPPKALVQKFDALVAPLFARQEANYEETQTLTALRDTLLPKLMRGEVRVKEYKATNRKTITTP